MAVPTAEVNTVFGSISPMAVITAEGHSVLVIDPLYHSNSTLSTSEKQALENAVIAFRNKYPAFGALYHALVANGITIAFKIDPNISSNAQYGINGNIYFKNGNTINSDNLAEELIHAMQHNIYGSVFTNTVKNYEFEAKVFQDLACTFSGLGCPMFAASGQSFAYQYSLWVDSFVFPSNRFFEGNDIIQFLAYCSQWTGYSGTFNSSFTPDLLLSFF